MTKPRLLAALLLAALAADESVRAQFPATVGQYERAFFTSFAIPGLANPFAEVKIRAVFRHGPTGRDFALPVVCTAISPSGDAQFPVHFTPPMLGRWTWWLELVGAAVPVMMPGGPTAGAPAGFACVPSTARGWWRPDTLSASGVGSGQYPFAIIEPSTDGPNYVWPLTTALNSLLNPYYLTAAATSPTCPGGVAGSMTHYLQAQDWAQFNRFNRVRTALTTVSSRDPTASPPAGASQQPPWHPSCVQNHTVFLHAAPTTGTWVVPQPNPLPLPSPPPAGALIDFERFDLSLWSWIDTVVDQCRIRNLELSIALTSNTNWNDYEEHYLAVPPPQAAYAQLPAPSPIPMSTPGSPFGARHEFYYWYVVGRLATYTNVEWSLMHEHSLGSPNATPDQRPYPSSWVAWFGNAFKDIEPYLAWDIDSKIVDTTPQRGTLYAENPFGPSRYQTLSSNVSAFLDTSHDSWRSCIGLQRGGELGVTSIVEAVPMLQQQAPSVTGELPPPWFPRTYAHQTVLLSGFDHDGNPSTPPLPTTPRPILIEEDWVTRNVTGSSSTAVAASFSSPRNPYCHACQSPNTFSFLADNDDGLRKYWRDAAWMCGLISQAYLSWWGPARDDISIAVTTTISQPLTLAHRWAHKLDFKRFRYAPGLVAAQSPAAPLFVDESGVTRTRFELKAIGAKTAGPPWRYIVYCPYEGTTTNLQSTALPGPASVTLDLSDLGADQPFTYRFLNPDTGESSRVFRGTTGATPTAVPFPLPPAATRGGHNEYVLLVN